jgi:hypothetical protein
MNGLGRLARSYNELIDCVRKDRELAEKHLGDYEARLGKPSRTFGRTGTDGGSTAAVAVGAEDHHSGFGYSQGNRPAWALLWSRSITRGQTISCGVAPPW